MLRYLFVIIIYCLSWQGQTQEDAWVFLTDKANVADALANPTSILTQKAIDRKEAHGISIDYRDVPVNEIYVSDLKLQSGITVLAKSKWFNAVHVRGLQTDIESLENLVYVDYVDFANTNLGSNSRLSQLEDKMAIENQAVSFNYGNTQNQVEMINVDQLHVSGFTGEGITIAVMDSGFPNVNTMDAFQRLRDNGNLLGGYDFVNRTQNVYANTASSHGTRVLSCMAAFIPDDYVGTAPDASYYLFLTEDVGSENPVEESYWVEAAERADSLGVDMINTSLGYRFFDNPNYNYTPSDMNGQVAFISKGASIAAEKGILVVVSAGNAGATAWQTVGAPADSPNVLSVGGVDENGDYVAFSSRGGAAQIGYQKPDVVARAGLSFVIESDNSIVQNNGTSFSAPILCGGIASLWQDVTHLTPIEIREAVVQSGSQFSTPDDFLGHGIPNLWSARNEALNLSEFDKVEVSIYPNPVEDELQLKVNNVSEPYDVSVMNYLGKTLYSKSLTGVSNQIDVSRYAPGLYLLTLKNSQFNSTFKFIIQ
ncbi:S8 family serine peptidase [Winogradskyella sp. DF17]|uniref:S8 family serine peptidase n=1 Tax=Winogradskyella pelagia TaxID=2819984 RepID=A0ABS3T365_9FLAO|nr:S8 family serine peptidase [Winogradskyella sp. DF17]MBO3116724.1 S8 family serine peptidase [Winogradskyella sp. DF17]